MKKHHIILTLLMLAICSGCSKEEDIEADLASGIAGIYEGRWDVQNNAFGTCDVGKVSDRSVKLNMEIMGIEIPEVPDVKLSDGGNGKTNLNYSDPSGTISGSVQSKVITIKITDGSTSYTFTGNKK